MGKKNRHALNEKLSSTSDGKAGKVKKRIVVEQSKSGRIKRTFICYNCNGYFRHDHKHFLTAWLCHLVQDVFDMNKLYFIFLRVFNPEKLIKIMIAMRHKRTALRRLARGKSII